MTPIEELARELWAVHFSGNPKSEAAMNSKWPNQIVRRMWRSVAAAVLQREADLKSALAALVKAEHRSCHKFTAREIDGIEAAMKRAEELLGRLK